MVVACLKLGSYQTVHMGRAGMGEAGKKKSRTKQLLEAQPFCIFCGGTVDASTMEHCPPRAMFEGRHAPEGYEFSACVSCNSGSKTDDALVTFLSKLSPDNAGVADGNFDKQALGIFKHLPELWEKMLPTAVEARRLNKQFGIEPEAGSTHQESGLVRVTDEMQQAMMIFALKLAKAIFYKCTSRVFPQHGCIVMHWATNAELVRHGEYLVQNMLSGLAGTIPKIERNGKSLAEQFHYKVSFDEDQNVMVVLARFRLAFAVTLISSPLQGSIENWLSNMVAKGHKMQGFTVLQSSEATDCPESEMPASRCKN